MQKLQRRLSTKSRGARLSKTPAQTPCEHCIYPMFSFHVQKAKSAFCAVYLFWYKASMEVFQPFCLKLLVSNLRLHMSTTWKEFNQRMMLSAVCLFTVYMSVGGLFVCQIPSISSFLAYSEHINSCVSRWSNSNVGQEEVCAFVIFPIKSWNQ